jgi:AcrR family transcriptional regulator
MGIRRVTMDDIAGECGVSKKTIYQHFKDKDTVVLEVTKNFLEQEECDLKKINEKSTDPLEELVNISKWFREMLHNMDNSLLFDMKKYHPQSWKYFQSHKESCVLLSMKDNLTEGIKLGLYRDTIDINLLSRFRLESATLPFNEEAFPKSEFKVHHLQLEIFDHFVYGIVSEKGKLLFEKYKSQETTKAV